MRSDARERREALLTAGEQCFREQGFTVPLEQIADRAGVGRGTLYRNFKDAVTLEDLDIEIHFVKESQILSKDSKSQIKFMHDIRLAVARNYSENLREEPLEVFVFS